MTPKFYSFKMASKTTRHRLYLDDRETPYFVDVDYIRAHQVGGKKAAVYGSGLGNSICRIDGSSYKIAACFGAFDRISDAKNHAIELAIYSGVIKREKISHE